MCVQDCKGQILLETQRGERFVALKGEWESRAKGGEQQVDIFQKERKRDAGIKRKEK